MCKIKIFNFILNYEKNIFSKKKIFKIFKINNKKINTNFKKFK